MYIKQIYTSKIYIEYAGIGVRSDLFGKILDMFFNQFQFQDPDYARRAYA